jgi:small subunit ribosomal protein S5
VDFISSLEMSEELEILRLKISPASDVQILKSSITKLSIFNCYPHNLYNLSSPLSIPLPSLPTLSMSSSRSPKCLICTFTRTTRQRPRRPFHTTRPNLRTTSQPEPKEKALTPKKGTKALDSFFTEVKSKLRESYTPEQLAVALEKSSYNVEEKATLKGQSPPDKLAAHLDTGIDSYTHQQKVKLKNRFTPKELAAVLAGKESMSSYTTKEKIKLKERYTPEQIAVIEAGEKSIDPEDLKRAKLRMDPFMLTYLDDLAEVDNVVDKPIRAPYENHDPAIRFKTDEELENELHDFVVNKFDDEGDGSDFEKFWDDIRFTVGKESAERNPRSALAPALPPGINEEMGPPEVVEEPGKRTESGKRPERPVSEEMRRLMLQTGFSQRTIGSIRCKTLILHRVVNQTRLGKIQSSYCLAVAGNENGLIGIGEGKSAEIESAKMQAQYRAIRSMQPILRYEDRTIFGDVEGKVGAVELKLYNRPPGKHIYPTTPIHLTPNLLHSVILTQTNALTPQALEFAAKNTSTRSADAPASTISLRE